MASSELKFKKANSLKGLQLTMIVNYNTNNEIVYEIPKANLVSFTHKRNVGNDGNTFSVTIMGEMAVEFEYDALVGSHTKDLFISYGYQNEKPRAFVGEITGSDIKFEDMAIALTISGTVSVMSPDKGVRLCLWRKGISLTKIIDLICSAHKWQKGIIPRAKPLQKNLMQSSISDTEFLSRVLSSEIETEDGVTDFKVWFTYSGSKTILNYAPLSYCRDSGDAYIYDVYGTTDTDMLSFEVKNQGQAAYSMGSALYTAIIEDENGTVKLGSSKQIQASIDELNRRVGNLYGSRNIFVNSNYSILPSSKKSDLVSKYWLAMYSQLVEAEAELLGNVYIDAGTTITVVVYLKDGKVHYSSGIYAITEVEDVIDGSGFVSKLKLVKTLGSNSGTTTY